MPSCTVNGYSMEFVEAGQGEWKGESLTCVICRGWMSFIMVAFLKWEMLFLVEPR